MATGEAVGPIRRRLAFATRLFGLISPWWRGCCNVGEACPDALDGQPSGFEVPSRCDYGESHS